MTEQTKEVEGFFGPKQITRADFQKTWADTVRESIHLADSTEEFEEIKVMAARIRELAGAKWDRMK